VLCISKADELESTAFFLLLADEHSATLLAMGSSNILQNFLVLTGQLIASLKEK